MKPIKPIANDFYLLLHQTLKKEPAKARQLMEEVSKQFASAKDRQVYKLLYPFVAVGMLEEAEELARQHVVLPVMQNNLRQLSFPNPLSMYLMGFGNQFVLTNFSKRDPLKIEEEASGTQQLHVESKGINVFAMVAAEVIAKLDDTLKHKDFDVLISLLYTMILNNSYNLDALKAICASL